MKLEKPIDIQVFFLAPNTSFKYLQVEELEATQDQYIIKKNGAIKAILERKNVTQVVSI